MHTGRYCDSQGATRADELRRLVETARRAVELGLECHAGHGLCFDTVAPVAAIPEINELNIGHFLVGEAVFVGLGESIRGMRTRMDAARDASSQETVRRDSA